MTPHPPIVMPLAVMIDTEYVYVCIGGMAEAQLLPAQARQLCGFLLEAADRIDPVDFSDADVA